MPDSIAPDSLRRLVLPDRVHRSLYTDPAIFDLEMTRIFGRCWLFLAHESQIRAPGDFVRTRLGREDVIVVRARDGRIRALVNRCTHRGAQVCQAERGNTAGFACPYHAWTFGLDGALNSVPHRQSLPPDFDLKDPRLALAAVPRVESYRGFVFGSLAPGGESLVEHLGPIAAVIDNVVDRAPDGEIEQAGGIARQEYRGNWKLHHENANDTLHPGFVHESSVSAARSDPRDYAAPAYDGHQTHTQMLSNGFGVREWQNLSLTGFPAGHSYMGGFYRGGVLSPDRDDPVWREYRARLVARHGEEKTARVLGEDRFNNLLYPNVSINAQYQQIRVVTPLAVDRTRVTAFCFRLKGAPEALFHRAVRFLTNLSSPASMILSDDVEIFERVQSGLANPEPEWLDQSRGLGADRTEAGGRTVSAGLSELPHRAQYAAWLRYMTAAA
ncbi:MAG: aromatic ring-hydroxylating dioxygenase subunit alpha [Alphaproteobacteria bacterium]